MEENRNARRKGDAPELDCDVCFQRAQCPQAESGHFCTRFAREAPRDRGESPADAWARGEDSL